MTLPPKDYTPQEQIIAQVLDEFGLRYEQQYPTSTYTLDFYIAELSMVIEADGIYGHFRKRDKKRDLALVQYPHIEHILHIEDTIYPEVKETLWQALNKLKYSDQNENPNPSPNPNLNGHGTLG